MKKALLLLFLLCSLAGHSQKCFFGVDENSSKTGKKILLTRAETINKTTSKQYYFSFSIAYADLQYMVVMQLIGAGNNFSINKGQELFMSLGDGSSIILQADDDYQTKTTIVAGGGSIPKLRPFYIIGEADLQRIKKAGISKISMRTTVTTFLSDVRAIDNKKIENSIECILEKGPAGGNTLLPKDEKNGKGVKKKEQDKKKKRSFSETLELDIK